ncbi:hypothetical protein HELRODRAFT_189173 [Helobdella robusta]|uniref:Uncharacterized protein n=1 Tax=Helobdella robusta TaxID=6412 RepID=T1FQR1_HELRO|nr:hypothetical protein HELRODRAFT_189173 [Helobdella robusta]ESN96253.1 hypothetical protein HELRODRAFT_189173 [Helobdella robusta]
MNSFKCSSYTFDVYRCLLLSAHLHTSMYNGLAEFVCKTSIWLSRRNLLDSFLPLQSFNTCAVCLCSINTADVKASNRCYKLQYTVQVSVSPLQNISQHRYQSVNAVIPEIELISIHTTHRTDMHSFTKHRSSHSHVDPFMEHHSTIEYQTDLEFFRYADDDKTFHTCQFVYYDRDNQQDAIISKL